MTVVDPDEAPRAAFVLDAAHSATHGAAHAHRRAQLVHAAEGVLTITTPSGRWVAPPERAVWVPPNTEHVVASQRPFRLLTLYADLERVDAPLPSTCAVVGVDRLVAELMRAAATFGADYPIGGAEERLVRVILDRLPALAAAPILHLPDPTSPELRKIAAALAANPTDARTLEEFATSHGITERTAARRFQSETGMTFGRWRQHLRLLLSLERLAAGESVTSVAIDVGYDDVSSFIAAFKAALGETPARYFKDLKSPSSAQ